ncbi:MAG: alpha/beta hydrolase-fold protein [Planctomycetota bacterium]|nr:alpha/beta hydrolase-fold protein [Planctomycetota bacterium]
MFDRQFQTLWQALRSSVAVRILASSIVLAIVAAGGLQYCFAEPEVGTAEVQQGDVSARSAVPKIRVTLPEGVSERPVSGRLYLFLSQKPFGMPMRSLDWFSPEPFYSVRIDGFAPGESRAIDDSAAGFPDKLSTLKPGHYRVQAILDQGFYEPKSADEAGNIYSDVASFEVAERPVDVDLKLSKVVQAQAFPESKWVQEVVLKSDLLSKFHRREVLERCAVVLPASYYEQPDRRYPTIYIIPGFGGDLTAALRYAAGPPPAAPGEIDAILVFLSGRCKWGHHVYADSQTNGPRGAALIEEMIPQIDRMYRTIDASTARFVMGHSSGGWSSLWLQVTYPEKFGGVWSSAPDPADFRDFQAIDLYAQPPQNVYVDAQKNRRPIARRGGQPVLWFDSFTRMDDTLDRGGQLRSFEAVFSPLDKQGLPARLWDRKTGVVDPLVAKAWERYDIRLKLKRDWKQLAPLLAGKIHIQVGTEDTFYLDGATRLLAEELKALGSDAKIEFIDGADHGQVLTRAYHRRCREEMSALFRKHHGEGSAAK